MKDPLWNPTPDLLQYSQMTRFLVDIREHHLSTIQDYSALYAWSIAFPEQFWAAIWDFCGIVYTQRWENILTHKDDMRCAQWFSGSRLNFAQNLLRHRGSKTALISYHEAGLRCELSYDALYDAIAKFAAALKQAGVMINDRVVACMPNIPETIIAMLATTSLGAIWSSCSPDFGEHALLERFSQIQPTLLITTDGYIYHNKTFDILQKIQILTTKIDAIKQVVVVPYLHSNPDISQLKHAIFYADFLVPDAKEIIFEPLPFSHPIYILYSSGTTGKPKCIVHSAGSILLQHLKELMLHTNLLPHDIFLYTTTCGWMMWNWQVSGLAIGATLVLYDGSVFFPKKTQLFDLIAQEKITIFGTSAKYLSMIEKRGLLPIQSHALNSLMTILSTGSPLLPMNFEYVYQKIKSDVRLCSISGGTDIASCFALGNPILPIYSGELQCRGLGLKVEIYNEQGKSVQGEKGELVCTAPFPAMPIYFWNDSQREKYKAAYFEKFPGVWAHGDYAELTEHDGLIISGRSDAVLNPSGVRIGTADIYKEVEIFPQIIESLAIAQSWKNDVRIILFVKMQPEQLLDDALKKAIQLQIRTNLSHHHVPAKIIAVPDMPKTLSGKMMELAVRDIINGYPIKNKDVIANPEALDYFADIAALK